MYNEGESLFLCYEKVIGFVVLLVFWTMRIKEFLFTKLNPFYVDLDTQVLQRSYKNYQLTLEENKGNTLQMYNLKNLVRLKRQNQNSVLTLMKQMKNMVLVVGINSVKLNCLLWMI